MKVGLLSPHKWNLTSQVGIYLPQDWGGGDWGGGQRWRAPFPPLQIMFAGCLLPNLNLGLYYSPVYMFSFRGFVYRL